MCRTKLTEGNQPSRPGRSSCSSSPSGWIVTTLEQADHSPGVITPTQPKVPVAKVKGCQEGFQCVLVSPERVLGIRKGVSRGPAGPPGPPELAYAALPLAGAAAVDLG